jgi:hypothetical protein
MREYALIGVIMIVGVLAGAVYIHAVGGQPKLTLSDGMPKTQEERPALENQAIELALADSRIKQLANVSSIKIFSTFYMNFKIVYTNETTEGPGKDLKIDWDGKYRALVTIRYPDDTGYGVDVNITDKVVGEPKQAVWEEGKYFKYLS